MTMNPAALKALAKGDFKNAEVAVRPGGIEAQEKTGQTALVSSTNMPKEMRPSQEAFEKLGFVFGEAVDELFVRATLPTGWTRAATDHSMHSDVLDEKGRKRVSVFYKAAFYDRKADAYLVPRFRVEKKYPDGGGAIDGDTMIPVIVTDGGEEIHRLGEAKYLNDWETSDRLDKEGQAWLDANRPGWKDPVKGWSL